MSSFIGRAIELEQLQRLAGNMTANLIVIRGRRRIGKTRLIAEFAKSYPFYAFEGLMPHADICAQTQRDAFAKRLQHYFDLPALKADDWSDLFAILAKYTDNKKAVILFDEISWMAVDDKNFLGKLKIAWDQYFSKNTKLMFFLCSSISPWIEKNLLSSTGYLGRPTLDMILHELPLPDCNHFLSPLSGTLSSFAKLKILSVTGGIPRYLELLNTKMSAEENIQNLFFNPDSPLFDEFNFIFSDVYQKRNTLYKKIINTLIHKHLTQKEISDAIRIHQSGDLSGYLHDLELGGFVNRCFTWSLTSGKISNLSTYRLKDNYSRFHLKYIEPNRHAIEKGLFEKRTLSSLPGWESIIALQFENLVIKNHTKLIALLNIRPELVMFANPYFQHKRTRTPACQIDYLIQTRETAYLCEIKFSKNKIGCSVIKDIEHKLESLKTPKYMCKQAVLIHVNGVTEEVQSHLSISHIIDFCDFLK